MNLFLAFLHTYYVPPSKGKYCKKAKQASHLSRITWCRLAIIQLSLKRRIQCWSHNKLRSKAHKAASNRGRKHTWLSIDLAIELSNWIGPIIPPSASIPYFAHGLSKTLSSVNYIGIGEAYLNVSRIMVNKTNLPKRGTTSDVGGMISASKRKNTVSESKMEMERLTCNE